jgi:hypothetical protein
MLAGREPADSEPDGEPTVEVVGSEGADEDDVPPIGDSDSDPEAVDEFDLLDLLLDEAKMRRSAETLLYFHVGAYLDGGDGWEGVRLN